MILEQLKGVDNYYPYFTSVIVLCLWYFYYSLAQLLATSYTIAKMILLAIANIAKEKLGL